MERKHVAVVRRPASVLIAPTIINRNPLLRFPRHKLQKEREN